MSIEFKRTVIASRTNRDTRSVVLESGERIIHTFVAQNKDIRDYICAFDLAGIAFDYIPDVSEVLYALTRIRSPRYSGPAEPLGYPVDIFRNERGSVFIRMTTAHMTYSINVFGSEWQKLSEAERDEWREYVHEWVEENLIRLEELQRCGKCGLIGGHKLSCSSKHNL